MKNMISLLIIIGGLVLFSFSENVFGMPHQRPSTDELNPVDTWEEYAFFGFAMSNMAIAIIWSLTYKIKKEIKK